MSYVSLRVLLLLLTVSIFSHAFDLRNNTPSERKLVYTDLITATVFTSYFCGPDEPQKTFLLGGEYEEVIKRAFFAGLPVVLIGETSIQNNALRNFVLTRYSYKMYENYKFIQYLRKAHRFVLVASSQPILRSILQRTKDSPWANSDGFYTLVDKQSESRGCINARSFLWTAWEYDLLSVVFMCLDPEDGIVYYTYNPYTNSTPDGWYEVGRAKGRQSHPWIIMKRKYVSGKIKEECKYLDFDKTTSLNNYEIRLNAVEMEPYIKINLNASKMERFIGDNSEIIKILLYKLEASLLIEIYPPTYELGGIGPNGTLDGPLAPLSDGNIDLSMNTRAMLTLWKVKYTYPHTRSGLCVVAQPKPEVSEFTKLITFLSPQVMAYIALICLLLYFILAKNEGYVKAWLQVIRLMICVGIFQPPKVHSTRIFICMVLFLFLNVNALFQSHLSSLLTVPVYYRDIDTIEDLKESGYTLYGPANMKDFVADPVLESRYHVVPSKQCIEHVQNSSRAVCVGDCYNLYYRIKGEDLIRSKTLREMTQSYVTREDWPLYQRVDNIIQQMTQAGLILKSRSDFLLEIRRERGKRAAMKKGFKVMLLKQLAFSFYILGIGYFCATIIFVLELRAGRPAHESQNRRRNKKLV